MSDILRFVQDLALGGTSGVIAKTACAPLERIKIILQVQSANTSGVKVGDRTDRIEATDLLPALCRFSDVQLIVQYAGILDAMYRVPKEQGFLALWCSLLLALLFLRPLAGNS